MPKEFSRTERVGELIQRELSKLIQREIKDPRIGILTISEVRATKDLAYAKVYISMLAKDESEIVAAVKVLNNAAKFLRTQLAKTVKLRKVPELTFLFDKSVTEGPKLVGLIDKAIEQDKKFNEE
ncbi:MAG: ribosome-binding factor A [Legionellales bacterium]|nr:ribosome-binding factor A [Legionellales bacterium]|tara:strand:+ start:303 stop:677 length:375 start_codon:yes stop_codon:yes gene_type:complete